MVYEGHFPGMALDLGHNCYEHYVNDVSRSFLFVRTSWVCGMIHKNAKAKATAAHLANDQI